MISATCVLRVSRRLTIMKTKGRAMRMLAMANEDTLAETRKARPTPARLTRDMVRAKHRNAVKAGFNPERVADMKTRKTETS